MTITDAMIEAAARELGFRTPDSFARIRAALEAAERAALNVGDRSASEIVRAIDYHIACSDNGFAKVPREFLSTLRTHFRSLPTPGEHDER